MSLICGDSLGRRFEGKYRAEFSNGQSGQLPRGLPILGASIFFFGGENGRLFPFYQGKNTPVERLIKVLPNQRHQAQEMFEVLMKFLTEYMLH